MMENFDKEYWKQKPCPKYDCKKDACKCGLKKVFLAAALGDDSANSPVAPKNGAYCNAIVAYEANGNVYIYSTDGVPTLVEFGTSNIRKLVDTLGKEIENRISGDQILQDEIDAIKNSPDVVDIVATYADLIAYDTTNLGDNDIIRVLQDEEHDGASTYYRWDKPDDTWLYIGEVGDYYTKGQVNTLLNAKQDKLIAGTNITISGNVISSTGTAYAAGDGIIINNGTISINPAVVQEKFAGVLTEEDYNQDDIIDPSTLDSGYYILRPEVTLQINDEYIFSYDTDMLFYLNNGSIGNNISYDLIIFDLDLIQYSAYESDGDIIVEVQRYATQSQIDSMIVRSNTSPTTSTVGVLGQLYEDESTGDVYICTAIDDSDPNDIIYTWTQIIPGGGGDNIFTTLTTDDYNYDDGNTGTDNCIDLANYPTGYYYLEAGTNLYLSPGNLLSYDDSYLFCLRNTSDEESYIMLFLFFFNKTFDCLYGISQNTPNSIRTFTQDGLATTVDYAGLSFALESRILKSSGAPQSYTEGELGTLYIDDTNADLYQCTNIDDTDPNNVIYTWTQIGAGGGGPTVVQTTGTSQTDVMSQNAVTERVYPRFGVYNDAIGIVGANESQDSSAGALSTGVGSGHKARGDNAVAIGAQATVYAAGAYSVAVGNSAKTEGHSRAVAVGNAANAAFDNSVALGTNAKTTRVGEVNVGADTSGRGYNNTNYRVIGGVHDGQLAQDAATVNQVNNTIDAINTALSTNIPHIGA